MDGLSLDLFNPEFLIQYGGLALLLCIVFAETGLFFGFFLPGDSLLFVAGILAESTYLPLPIEMLLLYVVIAATCGSTVGYACGYWFYNYMANSRRQILLATRYMKTTQDFYTRHGMMTFIIGRFLPVIRTFVPILAGIVRVDFRRFFIFNLVGSFIWASIMILMGHWLGNKYPAVIEHIEWIIALMVVLTALPILISWYRNRSVIQKENL